MLKEFCDLTKQSDLNRFIIKGGENIPGFGEETLTGTIVDVDKAKPHFVQLVADALKQNPEISVVLLECTGLPVFANPIRAEFDIPVFDVLSLANFFWSARKFNVTILHDFDLENDDDDIGAYLE